MKLSRRDFLATGVAASVAAPLKAAPAAGTLKKGALGKYAGELPPGRYDSHTHVYPGAPQPEKIAKRFADAGLAGGILFSRCPGTWLTGGAQPDPEKAMDDVIEWCSASPAIYPFYWIDPGRDDACDLVDMACEKGIYGFKVIRGDEHPVDAKALKCYRRIAEKNKPLTFHTGILWDGRATSDNFRPANWERLLDAPHLRFALAHVSWPWYDECVAVYGKILNAMSMHGTEVPEMFIDTTPGTPKNYRLDALKRVWQTGYDIAEHVMYGTDCRVDDYNVAWSTDWQKTDDAILAGFGLGEDALDDYYRRSMRRYLFGGDNSMRKVPTPDGKDGNKKRAKA